jgi:hypothetical protein
MCARSWGCGSLTPILPTVQGEPDYQTIHAIRKSLQVNSVAIDTHLGGGTLGHMGLIVSDESYTMIDPATDDGPALWVIPTYPGRDSAKNDGTAAQISAARHIWEEDIKTYRTNTSVQQALKKQIIIVFDPIYLDDSNDSMVGFFQHLRSGHAGPSIWHLQQHHRGGS